MYKTVLLLSKNILLNKIHVFMPTHQYKLILLYDVTNIAKLNVMTTGEVRIGICVLHLELLSLQVSVLTHLNYWH